jgi:hypothetical protein
MKNDEIGNTRKLSSAKFPAHPTICSRQLSCSTCVLAFVRLLCALLQLS